MKLVIILDRVDVELLEHLVGLLGLHQFVHESLFVDEPLKDFLEEILPVGLSLPVVFVLDGLFDFRVLHVELRLVQSLVFRIAGDEVQGDLIVWLIEVFELHLELHDDEPGLEGFLRLAERYQQLADEA